MMAGITMLSTFVLQHTFCDENNSSSFNAALPGMLTSRTSIQILNSSIGTGVPRVVRVGKRGSDCFRCQPRIDRATICGATDHVTRSLPATSQLHRNSLELIFEIF